MFLYMTVFAVDPETKLYDYGPLGIFVVILLAAFFKLFNIILKDRDKAIADRDVMIQDVFTKVLPAITRNTEVLQSRQDLDRDIVDALKEYSSQMENNRAFKQGQNHGRVGGT